MRFLVVLSAWLGAAAAAPATTFNCRSAQCVLGSPCERFETIDFSADCDAGKYLAQAGFIICVSLAAVALLTCLSWCVCQGCFNKCGGVTINRESWWMGQRLEDFREDAEREAQQQYGWNPRNIFDSPKFAKGLLVPACASALAAIVIASVGTVKMKDSVDALWHAVASDRAAGNAALLAAISDGPAGSPTYIGTRDRTQTAETAYASATSDGGDLSDKEDTFRDYLEYGDPFILGFASVCVILVVIVAFCAFFSCGRHGACGCNGRGLQSMVRGIMFPVLVGVLALAGFASAVHRFSSDFCDDMLDIAQTGRVHGGFVDAWLLAGMCANRTSATASLRDLADAIASKDVCVLMDELCSQPSTFSCGGYSWGSCSSKQWALSGRSAGTGAVLPRNSTIISYQAAASACGGGTCTVERCATACTDASLKNVSALAVAAVDAASRADTGSTLTAVQDCDGVVRVTRAWGDCGELKDAAEFLLLSSSCGVAAFCLIVVSGWLGVKRFYFQQPATSPTQPTAGTSDT